MKKSQDINQFQASFEPKQANIGPENKEKNK